MEASIIKSTIVDTIFKITAICPHCGIINKHGSDTKGIYSRGCKGHEYMVRFG